MSAWKGYEIGLGFVGVIFRYQDRNDDDQAELMVLNAFQFIRSFLLNVLSDGFVKIRHCDILSTQNRKTKLAHCMRPLRVHHSSHNTQKTNVPWEDMIQLISRVDPRICFYYRKGNMALEVVLDPSAIPFFR